MKKRLLSTFMAMLMVCSLVMYLPDFSIKSFAATNAEIRSKMIEILYGGSGGYVSCDFDGYTTTSGRHEGIDCCNYKGAKVYSLISGTVIRVNNSSSLSTLAIYDSANDATVIYLHSNIQVSEGSSVNRGQFVAYEDNRGASAAHTHVELRYGYQKYASVSVGDSTLDNPNPYSYWNNVLFDDSPRIDTEVDNSYNKNVSCTAPSKLNTYDVHGNKESNRWVDSGDSCTAIEAYTSGYWKIDYPASGSRRIAYMKLSEWNPFANVILPGTVDTKYNTNVSCTAPSQIHTYDEYGNCESNRWVDAGDSCIAIEAYTNGYWKIDYPASGSRRIAYMKLSEWNPFANTILPGTVDTKYQTNVSCTAPSQINTYDANGNRESNRWVDPGDSCIAIEAYTNGYWKIDYPAGSTRRIAYMKLSEWNPFTNAWIVDTRYNTNVSCTAPAQIHTYDSNGNQESNRWVDPGDSCIAIEAYTNGFWKIDYPAGSVRRIAYMKLSEWNPFVVHTHSYTSRVTKEATCTVSGVRTYSCSCGDTYTETIPAPGHDYTVKTVAPTTTAMGYDLHTCKVCTYSFKDNYTDIIHTHSYTSEVTTEPTCTATGVMTYSCSCGDTKTETIPANGHKYTVTTVAPTTTAMGYDLHTCTVCNYSFKDNPTDIIHTHSYTSKVTKEPTCTVSGIRTYSCSCGDSYTETIPATGHKYTIKTVAPTTTTMGYDLHTCSVCKHSYKDNYTDPISSPKVPELTATANEKTVVLKWSPIMTAEKYGIAGYANGKWNLLDECYTISYELKNLKLGIDYKVAVVVMYDDKWNLDFSNAVTVALVEPTIPIISYEKGDNSVKLSWTSVRTAEKYGIFEYEDDYWNKIGQTTDTHYLLNGLAQGSKHTIAVVTYSGGKWNTDFSNAIVVTPKDNTTPKYPKVTDTEYSEKYHQFRLTWNAVDGATEYGIAVKLGNKWKIQAYTNKTNFTSPKLREGSTVEMVICAKVNGEWDISSINSRAFKVTVK